MVSHVVILERSSRGALSGVVARSIVPLIAALLVGILFIAALFVVVSLI
ncbi:Uncharacterised protein [Chlamydia trachomatis]|nr:Uncharacterised protein [Chlamydia trachomatis]